MRLGFVVRLAVLLGLLASIGAPMVTLAQCSNQSFAALFVLSGIEPGFEDLVVESLSVTEVGSATYPPESEIYLNIMAAFEGEVNPSIQSSTLAGDMWSWVGLQSSSQSLVDRRDGAVLFAGSVVWSGEGQVYVPAASSHLWAIVSPLAPSPGSVATIDNQYWSGTGGMTDSELGALGVEYLRSTDVVSSFGGCGDYEATSWVYTPAVGAVDISAARLIVVIEGKVGPPWSGQPVAVAKENWGTAKAMYR